MIPIVTRETILIVDDNPTNLSVLFDSLESVGYKVLVATNGEAAIEAVTHTEPDIILLDVRMPGIDGFETCRRLKEDKTTRDIPIIFMTALTDAVDEVMGLQLGAVDYITKPIKVEVVLARLETHLTIRNLQKSLQKQNAELDAFAHTVAHDLKNPLTAMIGLSDMVLASLDEITSEELQHFLHRLSQSGYRMDRIIDELLLLSSVRKVEDVAMDPLDMTDIITEVQERLANMIEEYQAHVILPEAWPTALGHGPWVEEIWANYISNAIKYGGQPPHVELGADAVQQGNSPHDTVRFWVRDNGPGIASERHGELFTEFTRLSQMSVTGHGLGLSIVQRIAEKLGGQVGVESQPDQGSLFFFTLPAA